MFMTSTTFYKTVTVVLILSVALTACTMLPRRQSYPFLGSTSAEQQMRQSSQAFDTSNLEACLVVGGAAGLLVYLLENDNERNKALIAAVAGCGVGVGANYYVQTRRSQYADSERRLQAVIADVRADNARLSQLMGASKQVIAADLRKIEAMERAYDNKKISLQQARAQLRTVDGNRVHLQQTLAKLRERERRWSQVAEQERRSNPQSPNIAVLDREIVRLKSQINSLERELDLLIKRRTISPIG